MHDNKPQNKTTKQTKKQNNKNNKSNNNKQTTKNKKTITRVKPATIPTIKTTKIINPRKTQ